jgi:hypothetical protein
MKAAFLPVHWADLQGHVWTAPRRQGLVEATDTASATETAAGGQRRSIRLQDYGIHRRKYEAGLEGRVLIRA